MPQITGGPVNPGEVTTNVSIKHLPMEFAVFPLFEGFENIIFVLMAPSVFGPLMTNELKSSRN